MRLLLLQLIMLTFVAQVYSQDTVTVLSHNVLAFSGYPNEIFEVDPKILSKAVAFYREVDMDILVIQESPPEDIIQILADSLGFNYFFLEGKHPGDKVYPYGFPGSILTRYPVEATFDLNQEEVDVADALFKRHLGTVQIKSPIGMIQVTSAHLCSNWGGEFRESIRLGELDVLFTDLPVFESSAHVIAGDFNCQPGSKPYEKVVNSGFTDTHLDADYPTIPVRDPNKRIDYIFYQSDGDIRAMAVPVNIPYYDDLGLYLSDHIPCMTQFYVRD